MMTSIALAAMTERLVRCAAATVAFAVVAFAAPFAANAEDDQITASWSAFELNGKPVSGPTLAYTTDTASGFGGCNRFSGPIATEDDAVQIGPLVATRMACADKADLEAQYLAALQDARTFALDGDTLVLKAEDGRVLVKFKK